MNNGIELSHIYKSFPGVKALDNVSLTIRPGEIHALMGENGAGKSTLMKILTGIYHADKGEIRMNGAAVHILNPLDAIKHGISIIHQELTPIPDMTVAENIFLRREPLTKLRFVDYAKLTKMTQALFDSMGICGINPRDSMRSLSVAKTQLVEIAKAASHDAQYIIMDEPTSAISEREVQNLFELIRSFKQRGRGILYISHKLDEIFQIADCITVMRDGQHVSTRPAQAFDRKTLISMMVNREFSSSMYPKENVCIGEQVLEVKDLSAGGWFEKISLCVRSGEILGVAGLMGAGRTELVESIFGLRKLEQGEILIRGKNVQIKHPHDAIRHKIALVPEDRKGMGLSLIASVKENLTLPTLGQYLTMGLLSDARQSSAAQIQVDLLKIKTPTLHQEAKNLSGGNQQKIVIGKWLLADADVVILDEPTRGIDVGAKNEIYALITQLAKAGKAIIMISSELPEIMGMSDRVVVMNEGRICAKLRRDEFSQETIMHYATLKDKSECYES